MLVGVDGLFEFQLTDFLVNLSLKVSAGSLELGHEFAPAAGNFRQTAWPEKDEGQQHQENDLREAEIHRCNSSSYSFSPRLRTRPLSFPKNVKEWDES